MLQLKAVRLRICAISNRATINRNERRRTVSPLFPEASYTPLVRTPYCYIFRLIVFIVILGSSLGDSMADVGSWERWEERGVVCGVAVACAVVKIGRYGTVEVY